MNIRGHNQEVFWLPVNFSRTTRKLGICGKNEPELYWDNEQAKRHLHEGLPQGERKSVLRWEIAAALPDLNDPEVLARLKASIAALYPEVEEEALRWMETVSMFDNEDRDLE